MTMDDARNLAISIHAPAKGATRAAISLLIEALKIAGMDVKGFAIIENGEDKVVEMKLPWGSEYANITMDNARTAIWDVLKQIPELRE